MNVIAGTPDCRTNYYRRLNPFSNTCMQQVRLSKTYAQAKAYCEIKGEYLATFGSVDAAAWLRQQQIDGETNADSLVSLTGPPPS